MPAAITTETARQIQQRAHTLAAQEMGASRARSIEQAIVRDLPLLTIDPAVFHQMHGTWLMYIDIAADRVLGEGARGYMVPVLDLYTAA